MDEFKRRKILDPNYGKSCYQGNTLDINNIFDVSNLSTVDLNAPEHSNTVKDDPERLRNSFG